MEPHDFTALFLLHLTIATCSIILMALFIGIRPPQTVIQDGARPTVSPTVGPVVDPGEYLRVNPVRVQPVPNQMIDKAHNKGAAYDTSAFQSMLPSAGPQIVQTSASSSSAAGNDLPRSGRTMRARCSDGGSSGPSAKSEAGPQVIMATPSADAAVAAATDAYRAASAELRVAEQQRVGVREARDKAQFANTKMLRAIEARSAPVRQAAVDDQRRRATARMTQRAVDTAQAKRDADYRAAFEARIKSRNYQAYARRNG